MEMTVLTRNDVSVLYLYAAKIAPQICQNPKERPLKESDLCLLVTVTLLRPYSADIVPPFLLPVAISQKYQNAV